MTSIVEASRPSSSRVLVWLATVVFVLSGMVLFANVGTADAQVAPGRPSECGLSQPGSARTLVVRWSDNTEQNNNAVIYFNGQVRVANAGQSSRWTINNAPADQIVHVAVALRQPNGVTSPRRYCGFRDTSPNPGPLPAPTGCGVQPSVRIGFQGITPAAGSLLIRNNGVTLPARDYYGLIPSASETRVSVTGQGGVQHYSIAVKNDRSQSPFRYCGSITLNDLVRPTAPASCRVAAGANTLYLDFPQTVNGQVASYQIWVNGQIVRDLPIATLPYIPSYGVTADRTYHVSVSARNSKGTSPRTYCGSHNYGAAPTTVASCSASPTLSGTTVAFRLVNGDRATTRLVVERRRNGGAWFWAGAVDARGRSADGEGIEESQSAFVRNRPSGTLEYRVRSRNGANLSAPRNCTG